jgi:hypothetical protein
MQFLTLLLLLAATSLASPSSNHDLEIDQRPKASAPKSKASGPKAKASGPTDSSTIGDALDGIAGAVEKCASAISGWNGAVETVEDVLKASSGVLDEMKKATSSISNLKVLSITEAMAVIGPTNTLSGRVDTVTAALLSKKAAFEKLGVLSAVTEQLKEQKTVAAELEAAVMLKMPALAKIIAGPMAKQFGTKLDAAIQQLGG